MFFSTNIMFKMSAFCLDTRCQSTLPLINSTQCQSVAFYSRSFRWLPDVAEVHQYSEYTLIVMLLTK